MMDDTDEVRCRIDAMLTRIERRDDYGNLLARGDLVRSLAEVDSPEEWRADLRRNARADKLKVRTGVTSDIVFALLVDAHNKFRLAEHGRYLHVLHTVVPRSVELRHEPVALARDGDEALLGCARCPALAYADAVDDWFGGELIEDECPHEDEPRMTALAFLHPPPSCS